MLGQVENKVLKPLREATERSLSAIRRFGRDEDGSFVVFTLFILIVMLIGGGMAVDFVRYEADRARLQATIDRAVLAASALDQPLDPEYVVEEYFRSAGILDQLVEVIVEEDIASRTVTARAVSSVNTTFIHMLGYEELPVGVLSRASETFSNIEVSLVLDVSGSMDNNDKLENMQEAAEDFVTTLLENDTEDKLSISLIPYNGQVNLGEDLWSLYNIQGDSGITNFNCTELADSVYNNLDTLHMGTPLTASLYVDSFSSTNRYDNYYSPSSYRPREANIWCNDYTTNIVHPPSNNLGSLIGRIEDFEATGATSINAGMRWGLSFLDPVMRDDFDMLIATGQTPSSLAGRPYEYDDNGTLKVVVLMTDGQHFAEERLAPNYRDSMSPIWVSGNYERYSIRHTFSGTDYWYTPHDDSWRYGPYSNGGTTQLTWKEVWERVRMSWVAWQLYARPLGSGNSGRNAVYYDMMDEFRDQTPTDQMDDQLRTLCDTANDRGIIIFGVAFEAPDDGADLIAHCASSPAHFYDADGLEIVDAFATIANQIMTLRLTL